MPNDTIDGREGGLLPSSETSDAVGFPQLPRGRKEGIREAILSVSARMKRLEERFEFDEGDDDGEAV